MVKYVERERPTRARKDRTRWCRGKVGVEHTPVLRPRDPGWGDQERVCHRYRWAEHLWVCYEQIVCTSCGKILKDGLPVQDCAHFDGK